MSYYFSYPPGDPLWLIYMQAQSNLAESFSRQSSSTCCAAMHARLKGIGLRAIGAPGGQFARRDKYKRK